jgi:hypothetical protein
MNVLLSLEECYQVIMRMTGTVLDKVELSEEARDAIRDWRKNRALGTRELEDFTVNLNEALGNHIDERLTRRLRLRGGLYVTEKGTGR